MKIALITSTFNEVGGVEIFNKNLIRILKEDGNKVSRITLENLNEKPKEEEREKVLGDYFNKINKTKNYDVVICNGEFGYSVEHSKAINVFHGGYYGYALALKDLVPEEKTQERLRKAEMQKVSSKGKYIVAVSNFAKEMLENFGINVNKVINLSVNTNIFYPDYSIKPKDYLLALSRGRYYEKGFDVLKRLSDKGMKIKLFSDIQIDSPNVENKGFIKNNNLRKEYTLANLFLNPTRFEGGGLTTLEAMACACPVLTTPTGYGFDIKKEINNFVADSFDEFFVKAFLVSNEREKYSKEAFNYFQQFHNPEDFKKNWISLIKEI